MLSMGAIAVQHARVPKHRQCLSHALKRGQCLAHVLKRGQCLSHILPLSNILLSWLQTQVSTVVMQQDDVLRGTLDPNPLYHPSLWLDKKWRVGPRSGL